MTTAFFYIVAALGEVGGGFAFWRWWRMGCSVGWLAPGLGALALFAWALAQVESPIAGRAFAAYGGVYTTASLGWLWVVEGVRPDRWDVLGATLCLLGAAVILLGPRPVAPHPRAP